MPICRTFRYGHHNLTGEPGLQPTWFEGADPVSGTGVSHDMLEHFRTDPGESEGERLALGAYLLLRIENGTQRDLQHRMSGVGIGVHGILRDIVSHNRRAPLALKTRPLPGHSEQRVQHALREAFDDLDQLLSDAYVPDSEVPAWKETLTGFREAFASWIRQGYRRAQKRYRGVDLYGLGGPLFEHIGKEVDKLLNANTLWDSALVRISVDPQRASVAFKVKDPEYSRWIDGKLFA